MPYLHRLPGGWLTRRLLPALGAGLVVGAAATVATVAGGGPHQVGSIARPAAESPVTVTAAEPAGASARGLAPDGHGVGPGYTLATPSLYGYTPKGLSVWVDPGTPHHASIAAHTRRAVAAWRRIGIHATFRGYGTPDEAEGVVTVTEGPAGCDGSSNRVGNTWQTWQPMGGGRSYVSSARVVICPSLYRYGRWQQSATIVHELGHAAGLGHYDGRYGGSTQVMRSVNHAPVAFYRRGDLHGLRYLAAHTHAVEALIPPQGAFENTSLDGDDVTVDGWAMLDWFKDRPVEIVVTDNGKVAARGATTLLRSDVNDRLDAGTSHAHGFEVAVPYRGGAHTYCVEAVSTVRAATRTTLGCATWN
ncbi:MAG: hypothetical protein ACTHOK_08255 [Nocardioidaceae bacterium]